MQQNILEILNLSFSYDEKYKNIWGYRSLAFISYLNILINQSIFS